MPPKVTTMAESNNDESSFQTIIFSNYEMVPKIWLFLVGTVTIYASYFQFHCILFYLMLLEWTVPMLLDIFRVVVTHFLSDDQAHFHVLLELVVHIRYLERSIRSK